MRPRYKTFICLHVKPQPLFLVEDIDNYIYKMDLNEFCDAMCFTHQETYSVTHAPHIVCLRATERNPKDYTNVDFAIHTFLNAPDSVFGTNKLWSVYWMLWEGLHEKMSPQP